MEGVDLFANPCTPRIYKLTARALRSLGDRHSPIRREHSERTVLYKLLRLQFICEQQKAARATLALSEEKERALFAESDRQTRVLVADQFIEVLPDRLPRRHRRQ